jgi:hypothetical protein
LITEVVPRISRWENHLCGVEHRVLASFREHLQSFEVDSSSRVSAQLRKHVKNYFLENSWIMNYKFATDVPEDLSDVNYRFDGILDLQDTACQHRHRFLIEICFDNRQSIGTNLLKFELAAKSFESSSNRKAHGFMLCADRRALRKFGWDESAGSSEEYEVALRGPYGEIMKHQPTLLVIRT